MVAELNSTSEEEDSAFTGVAIAVGIAVELVEPDEDTVPASDADELAETEGLSSCNEAG